MITRDHESAKARWTSAELAAIVGGRLVGAADDLAVAGISTDSRSIAVGEGFLALRGENFDGLDFAAAASAHGAVLIIAEAAVPGLASLVVDSAVDAYAAIARHHLADLRQRTNMAVVGITGSSGKTSTKDLLVSVLQSQMNVTWPIGSFNNDIGLPATVLAADENTDVLVLEMGMRGMRHIERLCSIAAPDISVVLNVGLAHVGEVGDIDSIARAKSEIVRFARPDSIAVLNADDQRVCTMANVAPGDVTYFGQHQTDRRSSNNLEVSASDIEIDNQARPSFTLTIAGEDVRARVSMRVSGEHQVSNALAVAAVAHQLGMACADIAAQLSTAKVASDWRMDVVATKVGVTVVNDAYNANPQSMAAGLKAAAAMARQGRLIAVLGDMRELGNMTQAEHARIGELASHLGVHDLYFVGEHGEALLASCPEAIVGLSWQQAADAVAENANPGDLVFIKASRGVGLERVAGQLIDAFGRVDS